MSWTESCTEGSYTKYNNLEEVKEVLDRMGFQVEEDKRDNSIAFFGNSDVYFDESTEVVLALEPIEIDGEKKNLVGFISDSVCDSIEIEDLEEDYGLKEGQYKVVPIVKYLQENMVEEKDNILVVKCAGFDGKMSGTYNPFGDVTVISKFNTGFVSLYAEEDKLVAEFKKQYK